MTGITDVMGFVALGQVFTSVYTANMVFLGLSISEANASLASRVAVAAIGYIGGVVLGGIIVKRRQSGEPIWPRRVTGALFLEAAVFVLIIILWEASGTHPAEGARLGLLWAAGLAMGLQGAAVVGLGVSGLSSTYMTGTMTLLLHGIVVERRVAWRSVFLIAALVGGAALGGLLLFGLRWAMPVLPILIVIAVAALTFHPALGAVPLGERNARDPAGST